MKNVFKKPKSTRKIIMIIFIGILILFVVLLNIKIKEDIITGSQEWWVCNSFSFYEQKMYSSDMKKGDIILSDFAFFPPCEATGAIPPERDLYVDKVNAVGIYDAGNDTGVDCKTVNFEADKIFLHRGGTQFREKRVLCIKTKEGFLAKVIFTSPRTFLWNLTTEKITFSFNDAEGKEMNDVHIEPRVISDLKTNEFVPVAILMKEPSNLKGTGRITLNSEMQDELISILSKDFKLKYKYSYVFSGLAGLVSSQGLDKLKDNPNVIAVYSDSYVAIPLLTESVPRINATKVWNVTNNVIKGSNIGVCIIDSGIDTGHDDLKNNIVAQKCFCNNTFEGLCCPGGIAVSNNATDYNGHGTWISGVVAANGNLKGVAPESKIIAIKTYNLINASLTDIVYGINWCLNDTNRNYYNISAILLSFAIVGDSPIHPSYCDDADIVVIAANNASNQGVFVAAAAGNQGNTTGITSPACGSNVTSVGATYDAWGYFGWGGSYNWSEGNCQDNNPQQADQIGCGSNRASILDLLAPGADIYTTDLNSKGGYIYFYGTSLAAPHVIGTAALLMQYEKLKNNRTLSPSEIEQRFKDTGELIHDNFKSGNNGNGSGLTFPRIDAYAALFPIDVYDFQRLKASSTMNVFGFKIKNNYNNKTKSVSWSFDIGDGTTVASQNYSSLPPKNSTFVFFEYNYTDGDKYYINATATSGDDSDSEFMNLTIGDIIAYDMKQVYANAKERVFRFRILNNMNATQSVNWTFNTGEQTFWASQLTTLTPNNETFVYFHYNYTSGNTYTVNGTAFNVNSTDGTRNLIITVPA